MSPFGVAMCALLFGGIGTFTPFRIVLLLLGLLGLALGLHRLSQLERPPNPRIAAA